MAKTTTRNRVASQAQRRCTYCGVRKPSTLFHIYGKRRDRIGKWCESCYQRLNGRRLVQRRYNDARRRTLKRNACPPWADAAAVTAIYRFAAEASRMTGHPHHVEHWVPLQSAQVCGLHCETNLRIAPADLNLAKGNRFDDGDAARIERESMNWLRIRGLA